MLKFNIIIPVYNEGENISNTIEEIFKLNYQNIQIIICYDFDEDNTIPVVKKHPRYKKLNIKFSKNSLKGPHSAVMDGLTKFTDSDYSIVLPADDDYNVKNFIELFKIIELSKPDIICMSRFIKGGTMEGGPVIKTILMKMVNFLLKNFASIPSHDSTNGFKIFSRNTIDTIEIEGQSGFSYGLEYLVKANDKGLKIIEFPALWRQRKFGTSKFNLSNWANDYLKWFFLAFKLRILKLFK